MSKSYNYHKPSQEGLDKIAKLRKAFSNLDDLINETCTNSRERALAITALENAAMWAIKSIICNDPKSIVEPL